MAGSPGSSLRETTFELMHGGCEVALMAGISQIVGVFDPFMLRVYRRTGWGPEIVASSNKTDHGPIHLGIWDVSEASLMSIRERSGITDTVLEVQQSAGHAAPGNGGRITATRSTVISNGARFAARRTAIFSRLMFAAHPGDAGNLGLGGACGERARWRKIDRGAAARLAAPDPQRQCRTAHVPRPGQQLWRRAGGACRVATPGPPRRRNGPATSARAKKPRPN